VSRKTYAFNREQLSTRAMVPLTAEMSSYLKQIQDLCKDKGARYLDRSQVIRALVLALKRCESQVDFGGIREVVHPGTRDA
jgi:hypothetical protein